MNTKDKSDSFSLKSIKIRRGLKIMSFYIDNGVYKFSDIFEDAYPKQGAELERFFNELKEAYISYYNLAEENVAKQMDTNILNITHDFFINKFKMEEPQLTYTEVLGRKHLMAFLEHLILNFKSKNISSKSLTGLSKAYYFLDNYKKINFQGFLRLDTIEKGKNGNIHCYVLAINTNKVILSYEGYIQDPYGGDSEYEEMFNFDYEYDNDDEPEQKISRWKYNFDRTFKNTGTFSIDDSTEDIEEIEQDDDGEDDENEDYLQSSDNMPTDYNSIETNLFISVKKEFQKIPPLASDDYNSAWDDLIAQYGFGGEEYMLITDVYDNALVKFFEYKFNCLNQDDKQFLKNDYSNNNQKSNSIPDDIIISEIVGRFKLWIEDNFNVDDLEDDDDDEQVE